MDLNTVFTKTSKGAMEVAGKSRDLSREQIRILQLVDGKSSIGEILDKAGRISQGKLEQLLGLLSSQGFIRILHGSGQTHLAEELGFSSTILVDEANTQMFMEAQAAHERLNRKGEEDAETIRERERIELLAELKAESEAAAKAKAQAEADAKAKVEAEEKARQDAERKAAEEAKRKADEERKARLDAELKARSEAERKAREEAERKAAAEAKARADAEARAKQEAEAKARAEAEAKEVARKEAEAKARAEAEAKARAEAEERMKAAEAARIKAEEENQALARQLQEAKLATELEARAKRRLEARAREEEETRLRAEAEAQAKREEEARLRAEAEARAKAEAEAKAAEERRAREEAEAKAAEERRAREEAEARAAAERRAREEAEARAKAEAEVRAAEERRAREEAEAKAEAERHAREEAEAKAEAERRAREEAEARVKAEAERRAQEEAEAKAKAELEARHRAEEEAARQRAEAEAREREEAERRTRQEAEEKARVEEEARRVEVEIREAAERAEREEAEAQAALKEEAERQTRELAESRAQAEAAAIEREEERKRAKAEAENHARQEAEEARRRAEEQERFLLEEETREREEADARAQALAQTMSEEQAAYERSLAGKPKKQLNLGKWVRLGGIGLIGLLVCVFLLAHVISFNFYAPQIEGPLAKALGERVKIGELGFSAFPPRWRMERITIGVADDIKIGKAELHPALGDWFGDTKRIQSLNLENVQIDTGSLARLSEWRTRQARAPWRFERIDIKQIKLDGSGLELPTFDARLSMNAGTLGQIVLTTADRLATAEIEPLANTFRVHLHAQRWTPPLGVGLQFDELDIQGVAHQQGLDVNAIQANLHGGSLQGKGNVSWDTGWKASLEMELKRMNLATAVAVFTQDIRTEGLLEAKANISSESPTLAGLLAAPMVKATFLAREGLLGNVDLVRAINAPAKTTVSGGQTRFNDFSGYLLVHKGKYEYRQLRLSSGMFGATGAVDIDPDRSISGSVASELKTKSTAIRVPLSLSGTLATPSLKGGAGVGRPKSVETSPES